MSKIDHKISKYTHKLQTAIGDKKKIYESKLSYYKKQKGGEIVDPAQLNTALATVFKPVPNQSESVTKILESIEQNIINLKAELKQRNDVISKFYEEYVKMKSEIQKMNLDTLTKINNLAVAQSASMDDPLKKILDENLPKQQIL